MEGVLVKVRLLFKKCYNRFMKKFVQYFILEFVIIFVIGSIGYWILGAPFDINQILFVSLVSGAIIAYAMLALQKRNQ